MNFISLLFPAAFRTPATCVTRAPRSVSGTCRMRMFSLISSLPSSLSADVLTVFVRMVHRYYAAVRLLGRRTCGPCGLSLLPPTCGLVHPQVSPRSPGSRA